ncbi:retention module-containing protein, partial [Halomonas ventosae]
MTIAIIIFIRGQAWARDEDGNLRELRVGDTLQEGETLITSTNGQVQLDFYDNLAPTVIEGGQEVVMTLDLAAEPPVTAEDASVQDADLEALLTALDEGEGDLLEELDATAAGAGAGGAVGGGHDFVRLARINENLDPLTFEFATTETAGAEFEDGVATAVAEVDAVVQPVNDGPTIDVTAAPAFNENDAVAGQSVATFSASDEEDGALTASAGQVTFSPGSNDAGYYAFDGENVVLTQAGVDAINAGTELPAVSLTATDSANATTQDSDTPSYVAQNDGPTIDVTAAPAFNENDAVAGQSVATFSASDEEDGALTASAGQVTFSPGSNDAGYYAFDGEDVVLTQAGVDAINAGTELPAVSLTATDSANATTQDSDTP